MSVLTMLPRALLGCHIPTRAPFQIRSIPRRCITQRGRCLRKESLFIPTSREAPSDAVLQSHKLLIRGGYLRAGAAGTFSLLPLGYRILGKIKTIVDEEMENLRAHKLSMPSLLPVSLWKESGRWQSIGSEVFQVRDRKNTHYILGPTHEEAMADIVRSSVTSYRELPLKLYQIGTKFRDEARPRAGLLRGREFLMKDLYSFHMDEECARKTYSEVIEGYHAILARLHVPVAVVEADSGNIGGSHSHEFHILSDSGEDVLLSCPQCGFASNVEKLPRTSQPSQVLVDISHELGEEFLSESTLSRGVSPRQFSSPMIKISGYLALQSRDRKIVVSCTPGDLQVNEVKLMKLLGCDQLSQLPDNQLLTPDVIVMDHDFVVPPSDDTRGIILRGDICNSRPGEPCPSVDCDGTIVSARGIEIGHVFLLGTRYTTPMNVKAINRAGAHEALVMGCYGLGLSRILAAVAEVRSVGDEIRWPVALAPYKATVVSLAPQLGPDEPVARSAAQDAYNILNDDPIFSGEIVLDDSTARAGSKLKDAALIGYPLVIIIGKNFVKEGLLEVNCPLTGRNEKCTKGDLLTVATNLFQEASTV